MIEISYKLLMINDSKNKWIIYDNITINYDKNYKLFYKY